MRAGAGLARNGVAFAASAREGLGARTTYASLWVIGTRLATKLIDFCSLLILARLLGPEQFGLVAMAMTAVFVVEAVFELPLAAALLRVGRPTAAMYDTAFTLSLLRGVVVAALLLLAAWGMSLFYKEPRLFALIGTLALAPVARGLISPRMVRFAIRFDFRRDFLMELSGKLVAFVLAVSVALQTGSYWALAIGTVSAPVVMMVVSHLMAPQRLRWSLAAWPVFADMLSWNTLSQVFAVINWQVDRIMLGRFVGPTLLGRYGIASDLTNLPMQVVGQQVMRPFTAALAQIDDPERARAAYCKASASLLFLTAPLLLCMSVYAESVIAALLGSKWLAAGDLLRYLALIALLGLATVSAAPLAMVHDRMRLNTYRVLGEAAVKLPLMFFLVQHWQAQGALVAQAVGMAVGTLIALINVRSLIGIGFRGQVHNQIWTVLALLVMMPLAYLFDHWLPDAVLGVWPALIIKCVASTLVYVAIAGVLWHLRGRPAYGEGWILAHLLGRLKRLLRYRSGR